MDNYDRISDYDSKSNQTEFENNYLGYDLKNRNDEEEIGCCLAVFNTFWSKTFGKIGGDWLFLTMLGISMAWISLLVEFGVSICVKSRLYLYRDLVAHPILQYLGWIWLPVCLILFSTAFTRLVAPQAAGSGIPEMKTILKGVVLKESFSLKTLIAKVIGLTTTLGTGLPLGKEGPFVHIASIAAFLLTKAIASFKGVYDNKARNSELLAAACAVGVATAFATPIGGVLFSIEVTAVHFAVRNYWRGFYAAVCATVMHRLLAVWFKNEETLTALFRTSFILDKPFSPQEIFVFVLIGVICGFLGAFFVWAHRKYVTFKNKNHFMASLSKRSMLLYPFLVTLLYTTLTFPLGLGMFVAGDLTTSTQVKEMFSNFSWVTDSPTVNQFDIVNHWQTPYTGIFINLFIYVVFTFFGTILASTIPVPAGIFIPVFKMGAALGRMVGEAMVIIFPYGIHLGILQPIVVPGGYAIVGAAALAGAVTHTVSSSVIAFELTGQLVFALPVMIAVFIANGIAQSLQPSIFDSIITMKKLPYLPSIPSTSSRAYEVFVEDFMVRDVKFIWYGITYNQLKQILISNRKLRTFPIVDSADSMILLGSASRRDLISLIEDNVSSRRKSRFFNEWKTEAEKSLLDELGLEDTKTSSRVQIKDVFEDARLPLQSPSASQPPAESKSDAPEAKPAFQKSEDAPLESKGGGSAPNFSTASSDDPLENQMPNRERRPSRFSVTKVEGPLIKITAENNQTEVLREQDFPASPSSTITYGSLPRKSILKKTHSFVFETNKPLGMKHQYATIHGGESRRAKQTLSSFLKSKSLLRMDSKTITFTGDTKDTVPPKALSDRMKEIELEWEYREMKKTVDFTLCQINPAPHQLVERSNLLQVHSIFSLLGLNHSYVTAIGRLIGVVGLKELREVIERVNSGDFSRPGVPDNRRFSFGFLTLR